MSVEQISSQLSFALMNSFHDGRLFSGSRCLLEGLRLGRSGKLHSHSAPSSLPAGRVGELRLVGAYLAYIFSSEIPTNHYQFCLSASTLP